MGLPADTHLGEEVTRQVCQRTGSKAMVLGSVSQLGSQYVIGVKATDCRTGDSLGSEQAEAGSREQVLSALGKAATNMREKLGESLASVQKYDTPIEQATTPSLEALQAYSLGLKMQDTSRRPGFASRFSSAPIELDPNFAMAYARLGVAYFNLNRSHLAADNTAKAYELRDHASEKEKLYITCHYHDLVTGDIDQTIAAYLLLRQTYPREEASYVNLNSAYGAWAIRPGPGRSPSRFADESQPRYQLHQPRRHLHQPEPLRRRCGRHWTGAGSQAGESSLAGRYYALAFLRDDKADMAHQLAAAMGKPGIEDQLLAMQSDTDAYYGRLLKADEILARREIRRCVPEPKKLPRCGS